MSGCSATCVTSSCGVAVDWENSTRERQNTVIHTTLVVITTQYCYGSLNLEQPISQPQIVRVHYTRIFAEQYLSAHISIITICNVPVSQDLLQEYSARHSV